jgi:hypothetical protein
MLQRDSRRGFRHGLRLYAALLGLIFFSAAVKPAYATGGTFFGSVAKIDVRRGRS